MPITYGDISLSRLREFATSAVKSIEIVNIDAGATYSAPLLINYILESDAGTSATVDVEYSTNSGGSYSDATPLTSHASHSGVSGLAADADQEQFTFVWDVETDLGASYSASTVKVRLRASDGSVFTSYIESSLFGINLIPEVTITSPSANSIQGTPVLINYSITNNRSTTGSYSATVEYSTNSGGSYSTATADTSHSSHSGVSSLSAGAKTFVWNSLTNLSTSFNNTVLIRLRVNDGTNNSSYATLSFTVNLTPSIEITAPIESADETTPVLVVYTLTSLNPSASFTVTAQYSSNTSSPSYQTMTPNTSHSSHSGLSSLSSGSKTFVWTPISDVGSVYASDVIVKLTATDGTTSVNTTKTFNIDVLPTAPILVSPDDTYFDSGALLDFVWQIPSDPGSENLLQRFEIDDDLQFGSPAIDHNSNTADEDRFRHYITSSTIGSVKQGFNGLTYLVRNLSVTSLTGNAFSYANLKDHNSEASLPSSLTNAQILILNKNDRLAYANLSSINSSGFTLKKSNIGTDTNAKVDVMIFSGSSLDTYWVDVTMTGATHNYTLGSSPFATDLLSQSIPSSITDLTVDVLPGSDRHVYVTNRANNGFTLKRSAISIGSTSASTTVRVCLRKQPNLSYQHRDLTVSSSSDTATDLDGALDDATNSSADWPSYVAGLMISATPATDRMAVVSNVYNDSVVLKKSAFGLDTNAQVTLQGGSRNSSALPFNTNIPPNGVPDSFEGQNCKYVLASALSTGSYYWRVRAGTLT